VKTRRRSDVPQRTRVDPLFCTEKDFNAVGTGRTGRHRIYFDFQPGIRNTKLLKKLHDFLTQRFCCPGPGGCQSLPRFFQRFASLVAAAFAAVRAASRLDVLSVFCWQQFLNLKERGNIRTSVLLKQLINQAETVLYFFSDGRVKINFRFFMFKLMYNIIKFDSCAFETFVKVVRMRERNR